MSMEHFVQYLLSLNFKKGHVKFSTLSQIHEHFAHYISLVKGVHYFRNHVTRELFVTV